MIVALLAAAVAAGGGPSVAVEDDFYAPKALTVTRGTRVTWVWKGESPHNVIAKEGPAQWRSSIQSTGTYSRKLNKTGRYALVCSVHADMTMTLRVKKS